MNTDSKTSRADTVIAALLIALTLITMPVLRQTLVHGRQSGSGESSGNSNKSTSKKKPPKKSVPQKPSPKSSTPAKNKNLPEQKSSSNTKSSGASDPDKKTINRGQLKKLTSLTREDTAKGSLLQFTSDGNLDDFSAYRTGERFYVLIPDAATGIRLQSALCGRGCDDLRVEKNGNDVLLSFRLLAGATARVNQKFNRLEIIITVPALAAANVASGGRNSNSNTSTARAPQLKPQTTSNLSGSDNSNRPASSRPSINKPFQNRYGIEMVWIAPGSFEMGSKRSTLKGLNAQPVHRVTIKEGFYMGKYEVTRKQWWAVMGNKPSTVTVEDDNRPIMGVSWKNAQKFIHKLNKMNDGYKYRLPTEAEWEYACRAGTTTEFAGDSLSAEQANFNDNYLYGGVPKDRYQEKEIMPVGSFQPNGWGLYDMHGNMSEWVEDVWHADYDGAPSDGSAWLTGRDNELRVVRSGVPSWARHSFPSDGSVMVSDLGFRLVAVAPMVLK